MIQILRSWFSPLSGCSIWDYPWTSLDLCCPELLHPCTWFIVLSHLLTVHWTCCCRRLAVLNFGTVGASTSMHSRRFKVPKCVVKLSLCLCCLGPLHRGMNESKSWTIPVLSTEHAAVDNRLFWNFGMVVASSPFQSPKLYSRVLPPFHNKTMVSISVRD